MMKTFRGQYSTYIVMNCSLGILWSLGSATLISFKQNENTENHRALHIGLMEMLWLFDHFYAIRYLLFSFAHLAIIYLRNFNQKWLENFIKCIVSICSKCDFLFFKLTWSLIIFLIWNHHWITKIHSSRYVSIILNCTGNFLAPRWYWVFVGKCLSL